MLDQMHTWLAHMIHSVTCPGEETGISKTLVFREAWNFQEGQNNKKEGFKKENYNNILRRTHTEYCKICRGVARRRQTLA